VVGSLSEAIAQSAPLTTPPLRQELEMVVKERRVGTSTPDCLASWVHRADSRLLASIVPVLVVGASSGGEYPRLIKRTADALRERKRLEQFVRKTTASGRFSLYLMAAMPVAFFYIGRELGPPFDATVLPQYGAIGYTILLLAAALWFASLVIGHRITRIDI
jgi:tight adherence protein B